MTFLAEAPSDNIVHYRGLRGWLDEVNRMGELLHVNGAHWDTEMGRACSEPLRWVSLRYVPRT